MDDSFFAQLLQSMKMNGVKVGVKPSVMTRFTIPFVPRWMKITLER